MSPQLQLHPARGALHILVVEDDVIIRALLADELRSKGFTVIEAGCADDAMSYIWTNARVDLIFSDIQMPGTLDGRQLAEVVAWDYPDIPVILTSGNVDLATQAQGRPFLRKPYRIAQVISLIFATLNIMPPEERL